MPYREAPPELDESIQELVVALSVNAHDAGLQAAAARLVHSVRSRCIDLASWHADSSPEYNLRVSQARQLTKLAREIADELLLQEFGRSGA